jgi:hypothetical protein
MYLVKVGISFQAPNKPFEMHWPGETAALDGWPADDLERFEAQGIIEKLPDEPQTPKDGEQA